MSVATTIPDLFTVTEAAEYLGMHPRVVRRYCECGRIPCRVVGRNYVITKAALDRFKKIPRLRGNPMFRKA